VGVNLPWSDERALHQNHRENPKVFGGSFKTLWIHVASLEHLHPTPANLPFHYILPRDSITYVPLQYLTRFAVVIFTPLKATMDVDGLLLLMEM
jgi:hypothetical protein